MNGEDGTIQGIFDMLQVPYMGPSVQGSAVGMNKIVMKSVFKANDIPLVDFLTATESTYNKEYTLKELGLPLIVKPANL